MDDNTHTLMQGLVQRAAAPGSLGLRSTYYSDDTSNNPPPSPTAAWKARTHNYQEPVKDPNRHPYLPHPYPLKRRGRAHSGHPGGFVSLQEPLLPPKRPEEDQVYMTYAEWWQAQRPLEGPPYEKDATFSTSYWPYGRRISCVASMDKQDQYYNLDSRVVKNHTFFKDKRDPMSMQIARSRSSAVLLGSQAEHFGYDRSLGRSRSSHASASFHATNPIAPGEPYAQVKKSGRNVWETMKAQEASRSSPPTPASVRSTSRPDSLEATAGSSRYAPKQSSRNLGLGQRTQAEWCLPQPPAYTS